jgi:hypothetical protein
MSVGTTYMQLAACWVRAWDGVTRERVVAATTAGGSVAAQAQLLVAAAAGKVTDAAAAVQQLERDPPSAEELGELVGAAVMTSPVRR